MPNKTLDIHGMTLYEAKSYLLREIGEAPPDCRKITVIHGSNNGTALRDMVRKRLTSPLIEEKVPTFANDGETVIYLKKIK